MSDTPTPALSAEQWAALRKTGKVALGRSADRLVARIQIRNGKLTIVDGVGDAASADPGRVIAVANDALDDNDPRKIAPQFVSLLRVAAAACEQDAQHFARELSIDVDAARDTLPPMYRGFADALESLLPPIN